MDLKALAVKAKTTLPSMALSQSWALTVLQLVCVFALLWAVSWFSIPVAVIVGAVIGILVIEQQSKANAVKKGR